MPLSCLALVLKPRSAHLCKEELGPVFNYTTLQTYRNRVGNRHNLSLCDIPTFLVPVVAALQVLLHSALYLDPAWH